jgi:hypothetical protein
MGVRIISPIWRISNGRRIMMLQFCRSYCSECDGRRWQSGSRGRCAACNWAATGRTPLLRQSLLIGSGPMSWCLVKGAGRQQPARHAVIACPIVWDASISRQPNENGLTEACAKLLLRNEQAAIRPDLTIGATKAMAGAGHGVYLPHHGRTGLAPTPLREHVKFNCFDGTEAYLGRWANH